MNEYYSLTIAGLVRELPICKISETVSIAAFVIFGDVELTVAAAAELLRIVPAHDIIITPESKAIALAHEMARQNGNAPYIVARKNIKLYMKDVLSVELQSITTENKQSLHIDSADAERMRGKRVLIVDDVISTGESLRAAEQLVTAAGGITVGRAAILAEGDAAQRSDIIFLAPLPLFDNAGNAIESI